MIDCEACWRKRGTAHHKGSDCNNLLPTELHPLAPTSPNAHTK